MHNEKLCEICGETAKDLCFECKSYFCDLCYNFVHEKKKNVGHKKEAIDLFNQFDIKCPEHPQVPINLFCTEDQGNIFIITYYFFINYKL